MDLARRRRFKQFHQRSVIRRSKRKCGQQVCATLTRSFQTYCSNYFDSNRLWGSSCRSTSLVVFHACHILGRPAALLKLPQSRCHWVVARCVAFSCLPRLRRSTFGDAGSRIERAETCEASGLVARRDGTNLRPETCTTASLCKWKESL